MLEDAIIKSRTVTKKELCGLLGFNYRHPETRSRRLDQKFDDKLLEALRIDRQTYKKLRFFDSVQTKIIIGHFQLQLVYPKLSVLIG